mgnify:CR=1 FL=1
MKSLRLTRHWSQEQLAQLSNLNVRTIQRIEKGEGAGLETLKSLASVFEISVDDLEEWAGFIEFCDDIDATAIEDYLYALSNPELMGEISKEKARQMIDLLEGC